VNSSSLLVIDGIFKFSAFAACFYFLNEKYEKTLLLFLIENFHSIFSKIENIL
jgi:hypothetical protein